MLLERSSGILLHPTCLASPFGIGDLGSAVDEWVAWLSETGCRYWQVLPLSPTGYGDSPYQSFSAFAGNPYLVSPQLLVEDGLISPDDLSGAPDFPRDHVDFGAVIPWKVALLDRAYDGLDAASAGVSGDLERFRDEQSHWLDDYALFMAVKAEHGGGSWAGWPDELRLRDPAAMRSARERLAGAADRHVFRQFLFFRQWSRVRGLVAGAGLQIIGDIPVYVAPDSADVWSNPDLFLLDEHRHPSVIAGVPPDFFSETGQLWGNPIYAWDRHAETGFAWWIDRLDALRNLVDLIRIDHFRAFADYWEVPAGSPTARVGRWVDGPGRPFFDAVEAALGDLPIIAEDLGELHDVVPELRDAVGLPGMAVLQFGLDGEPDNPFHPDEIAEHTVVYTGTHDNDTTAGWYAKLDPDEQAFVDGELGSTADTINFDMIETAWRTPAVLAVTPVQDVLGLGTEARMNIPSTTGGNWTWRITGDALIADRARYLADLNRSTGRYRRPPGR